jgi:ribosomal protein L19
VCARGTGAAATADKLRADMRGRSLMGFLEHEQIGRMGLRARQALLDRRQPDHLAPGCTVQVQTLSSKTSKRRSAFSGVCIAVRRKGIASNFVVRNQVLDEGVEVTFPLYSPLITSIRVLRRERVRRAKLYYLKGDRERDPTVAEASSRAA